VPCNVPGDSVILRYYLAAMSIGNNLDSIKKQLPVSCKLIAVTKTHPVHIIEEAYKTGHRIFGENKVQELAPKYEALPKDIEWHLIGHLQSNKVKYIAPFVSLIHSVDSLKLLTEINKQGEKANRVLACLLQVHIANEETKFGFLEDEIMALLASPELTQLGNIKIRGLMGMATFSDNESQVRNEFKSLKQLFDKLKDINLPAQFSMDELSMGMSGDYRIAIEEGSTMVRVGSAIFGHRDYSNLTS
jgi:pyridoxal phosphate enzyme (YggS family)